MAIWPCVGDIYVLAIYISTNAKEFENEYDQNCCHPRGRAWYTLLPASKAIPKEMLTVVDKPVIQYVVEEALAAGITKIVLVTRSGKEAIEITLTAILNWKPSYSRKAK